MDGLRLLLSFFPPVLTPSYLLALAEPVIETIGLAVGAMFIAYCVSIPLGIAAAMQMRGARIVLGGLAAWRAIPDLTLAILCVILFGVGPGAGLLALALYYLAAVAKMFSDILCTAPKGPLDALGATGASRIQIALFGMLPLKRNDLMTYGAYEFESALRASIVVGAVGGGGLGSELVGSLAAMDFQRVTTLILILVVVIALLDQAAFWLRKHPRWLITLIPAGIASLVAYSPRMVALGHAVKVFSQMFPPEITAQGWTKLPGQIWETVWMAVSATIGAVFVSVATGICSARKLAPIWLAWPVRRLMELLRTVPEVVLGLVLIVVAGVGPTAGALALGIHSAGSLSRLIAESLENAAHAPQLALASTGASRLAVSAYATFPLALGPVA
ncbi:MAG TPA: ABC transporter permease subunit, partial [Burkholderiales bacterium]|nr:ABC transporter permease subunit [Burkholderiales bacterium]